MKLEIITWTLKNGKGNPALDAEGKPRTQSTIDLINMIVKIGVRSERLMGYENIKKIRRIDNALKEKEVVFEKDDFLLIQRFFRVYSPAEWSYMDEPYSEVERIVNMEVK